MNAYSLEYRDGTRVSLWTVKDYVELWDFILDNPALCADIVYVSRPTEACLNGATITGHKGKA